jgi:hypothetical protein
MTNSVSKPLARTAELEKLQEEYMLILAEIVEYICKNLGQSIERQTVPEGHSDFWRKYSTKISIPKAVALKKGYGNSKFTEVRRNVNSRFHIYEEYEAEKNGVDQIVFLIAPKSVLKLDRPTESALHYSKIALEGVKNHIKKLSKDEYKKLREQIYVNGIIEIPIILPKRTKLIPLQRHLKRYPKIFKNIVGFRRPHANSEIRKQGYNLYVQINKLDF